MHHISGYIAKYEDLVENSPCEVISLGGGMGFVPMPSYPDSTPLKGFADRYPGLIAYIETDYFGGAGHQFCAVWQNGKRLYSRRSTSGTINNGLRMLGVEAASSDEFDTVGLGLHRTNESWLGK